LCYWCNQRPADGAGFSAPEYGAKLILGIF